MSQTKPAIAVMPHHIKPNLRPGRVALDDLVWPRGRPQHLMGADKTLRDLSRNDHLVVYTRSILYWRPWMGTKAQVSVMVLEPQVIHGDHMRKLRRQHTRFHKVLCANAALLRDLPNAVLFPLGDTWVKNWQDLDLTKSRPASLIASAKRSEEGHVLRHKLADHIAADGLDADVMGGGYQPFQDKSDGLAPYRFSVVIENAREENYFTEKLIDAILCQCVPIYWGCPNIADFIDPSGMIICQTEADLRAALQDLSQARYDALLPDLQKAIPQAAHYADFFGRAADAVLSEH